jgi:hypothetical protein
MQNIGPPSNVCSTPYPSSETLHIGADQSAARKSDCVAAGLTSKVTKKNGTKKGGVLSGRRPMKSPGIKRHQKFH